MTSNPSIPPVQPFFVFLLLAAALWLLTGCAGQPKTIPNPPKVIEVKTVVPVPCEIAQVEKSVDPATKAYKGDDIFQLAKIMAASRKVLMGENQELRAANQTPCPGGAQ